MNNVSIPLTVGDFLTGLTAILIPMIIFVIKIIFSKKDMIIPTAVRIHTILIKILIAILIISSALSFIISISIKNNITLTVLLEPMVKIDLEYVQILFQVIINEAIVILLVILNLNGGLPDIIAILTFIFIILSLSSLINNLLDFINFIFIKSLVLILIYVGLYSLIDLITEKLFIKFKLKYKLNIQSTKTENIITTVLLVLTTALSIISLLGIDIISDIATAFIFTFLILIFEIPVIILGLYRLYKIKNTMLN